MSEENLEGFHNPHQEEETHEQRDAKDKKEKKEVIDRIIRGVNDTFIKEYHFEDMDMHFTVKMRAPNALEVGRVQALLSRYLGGMNNYVSEYMMVVYTTLATLRVTGEDVPKELEKDEEIYNLDVLYDIGRDFQQWLNNFRK